jgi:UMF1 family MFS transporter
MGLVFPLWITTEMGGTDATVGFTLSVAMAIVFLISPVLGTVSDQVGRRMLFLIFFTLLGIVATFLIGAMGLVVSLAMFAVGVVAIHTADIFYNSLLEDVSSRSNVGTIAGLGIGLGYLGAIVAVVISIFFTASLGHVFVIRVLGGIMFVLMLPLLIVGKDKPLDVVRQGKSLIRLTYESIPKLLNAAKGVRSDPVWARFLVARFWYMWAVNAASSFAVLYGVQTVGLSETQVQVVLLLGIMTGVPSAAVWGRLVDKLGASFVLKTVVSCWLVLLIATIIIPILGLPGEVWGVIGILSGVFIAGLYVAERPLVISIAPEGRTAEYFSLNSMSGRLAAVAGPFSWGLIAVTLGLGQIVAVAWLGLCVSIAVVVLAKLHVGVPGGGSNR